LHTENQLPRLSGSAFKVPGGGGGGGVVGSYPLSSQAPTPVEVELGCDNMAYKPPFSYFLLQRFCVFYFVSLLFQADRSIDLAASEYDISLSLCVNGSVTLFKALGLVDTVHEGYLT
jgi:hypothetical protein